MIEFAIDDARKLAQNLEERKREQVLGTLGAAMTVKHRVERGVLVTVKTAHHRVAVFLVWPGVLVVRTETTTT